MRIVGRQLQVGAATVPLGRDPAQDSRIGEDPQVVGQQVAGHPVGRAQLTGGGIGQGQPLGDCQPNRLPQCGMDPRPAQEVVVDVGLHPASTVRAVR